MQSSLIEALIYLVAAVIAVPLAKRLGLGSVLGYLIAGILIAPLLNALGSDTETLQHFAEFGVVMMLFLVGLELAPSQFWRMRHNLLGLGGLQVGLTALAIMLVGIYLNLPWQSALAIGLIVAPSSTAIVVQTLSERGLLRSRSGRNVFSILLFQDMAIIPFLAILPLLALPGITATEGDYDKGIVEQLSLVEDLPAWAAAIITLAAILAVLLSGRYLINPLFRAIARADAREIFTAAALMLIVGIALLMGLVGVSAALGCFIAGVVLASSEYRHELEASIEPFKSLLLGLFFITVGARIDFAAFWDGPVRIINIALIILIVKAVVLYGLARAFNIRGRDGMLLPFALAQTGEFAFVLLSVADLHRVLPTSLIVDLNLVVAITMIATPLMFIAYDHLPVRTPDEDGGHEPDTIDTHSDVIIAGQGRFGQVVNRLLLSQGIAAVVLDHHTEQIERLRQFGVKVFFGDPTRPELLQAAKIAQARVLVVAIDDPERAVSLTKIARKLSPDIHIVARAGGTTNVYELYQAGANDIVREMFDGSVRAGRYALQALGINPAQAMRISTAFVQHDRENLARLAEVWDPEIPVQANPEYVALARELNSNIARALEGLLEPDSNDEALWPAESDLPAKSEAMARTENNAPEPKDT